MNEDDREALVRLRDVVRRVSPEPTPSEEEEAEAALVASPEEGPDTSQSPE